ncbi:hypothetical protein V1527DRAFT_455281 [Lipomyces starkeyi]
MAGLNFLNHMKAEQRPITIRRLERCNRHVMEHVPRYLGYAEKGPELLMAEAQEGEKFRKGSQLISSTRQRQSVRIVESNLIRARAPHVFLEDGRTSIFGYVWERVVLATAPECPTVANLEVFAAAAARKMPLNIVIFDDKDHAHRIWGQNHVLVRADGHAAWRGSKVPDSDTAEKILMVVTDQERLRVTSRSHDERLDFKEQEWI